MRIPAGASLAIAAALVLLAVAGQAQVPPAPSASPTVEVTADAAEGTVSVERASTFKFTVRNTSSASGTPIDAQNKASIDVATPPPAQGWTANPDKPSFQLAPGESATVTVQVSVAAGSPSQATLTVVATITSPVDPVFAQVPGAPAQKGSGQATTQLALQDSLTRNVMEKLGPWVYVLLLLLVAAVLVAVMVTVSSRRALVRLSTDTRDLSVTPGGKVAFPFRVEGLARDTDTVILQVSAVQEGWAAFLPVPELHIEPGQSQDMSLVVIAPRIAAQGTRQAVLVTATSAKAPKGAANLEFVALVEGVEDLPSAPRRAK